MLILYLTKRVDMEIKRLIAFALFVIIDSTFALARENEKRTFIYPRIGCNVSFYDNTNAGLGESSTMKHDRKTSGNMGFEAGLDAEHYFNCYIGISIGAYYSYKRKSEGDFTDEYDDVKYVMRNSKTTFHSICFPVLAMINIKTWRNSSLAFKGGLQIETLLSANTKNTQYDYYKDDGQWKLKDNGVQQVDGSTTGAYHKMSLLIPVGLCYRLGHLSLDARYNLGLTRQYRYINQSKHQKGLTVLVGYGITI